MYNNRKLASAVENLFRCVREEFFDLHGELQAVQTLEDFFGDPDYADFADGFLLVGDGQAETLDLYYISDKRVPEKVTQIPQFVIGHDFDGLD